MDDWNQNNSSWSGYGDDPWDMPPKTSARPQRHASRDESAGHSAAPGHTIGSCDADYANEAVNPGRKRIRWRRIVLPLVVALIAAGAALVIRSKLYRLYSVVSPAPSGFGTADSSGNSDNDFSVDIDPDGESDDRDESEAELTGPSDIARYTPDGSFTLETVSRAGMEELSYQEIYAQVAPSVVSIMAYSDNAGSYATGVILSEDGYILTNQHVVAGCSAARVVTADNESYDALLVGEDANTDLALLKIDAEGLTPAQFGDSEELVVGDECFAIGNPLSVRYQSTFSNGIISALNRNVEVNGYSMTLLQTTAALNEGSSGGPLINLYGQVIGIDNMKIMSSTSTVEGLGFSIPSKTVRRVVNALCADGEIGHPVIGITCYAVSVTADEGIGADGLYVATIFSNSDAAIQGLQVGDIITAIDGQPIRQVSDVDLASRHVGDVITATVWRDGETLDITFALSEQNDLN